MRSRAAERNVQHLVEIAIEEPPVIANADQRAAHQTIDGRRIEMIDEQSHVFRVSSIAHQLPRKAIYRHVRDRQQMIEADPKQISEMPPILSFEFMLTRRQ